MTGTIAKVFITTSGEINFYDGGIVYADDLATGEKFVTVIQSSRLEKFEFRHSEGPAFAAFIADGHPERWDNPALIPFEVGDRVSFSVNENGGFPFADNVAFINPLSEWEQRVPLSTKYEDTRDNFESQWKWRN